MISFLTSFLERKNMTGTEFCRHLFFPFQFRNAYISNARNTNNRHKTAKIQHLTIYSYHSAKPHTNNFGPCPSLSGQGPHQIATTKLTHSSSYNWMAIIKCGKRGRDIDLMVVTLGLGFLAASHDDMERRGGGTAGRQEGGPQSHLTACSSLPHSSLPSSPPSPSLQSSIPKTSVFYDPFFCVLSSTQKKTLCYPFFDYRHIYLRVVTRWRGSRRGPKSSATIIYHTMLDSFLLLLFDKKILPIRVIGSDI